MIHCLSLILLLGSVTPSAEDPVEFEVFPSILAWQDLSPNTFDRSWILPEFPGGAGRDFLAEMRRLVELRFDIELADGSRYRCFGELAAKAWRLDPAARQVWFNELCQAAPRLASDWGAGISQLLFDERLLDRDWKPAVEYAKDGLLFAESWDLGEVQRAPWNGLQVRPLMERAAALLRADLATIKAVENDYRAYPDNVGADYRSIFPIDGSYFIGRDERGKHFSTLTIQFTCDLPFPFSNYTTRLGILNRFEAQGELITDIYSTSKDFYWLAGRDVFLPLRDSLGAWVGFLLVRDFGFDLDGVPDGPENRRAAIRASLGNLKRNAEREYQGRSVDYGSARNGSKLLYGVRVLGRKQQPK